MTATNHALTGAAIGMAVGNPVVAVVLAFLSHFALDALPHFASQRLSSGSKRFVYYLAVEAGICASIVLVLFNLQPVNWLAAVLGAFAAASPDFMWVGEFVNAQNHKPVPKPVNWLAKFHSRIQWYQKEPGAFVEVAWAGLMLFTLAKLLVI